ncbi:hypothetical protein CH263_24140 [Rhodococcus sp. 06-1059B-a]|nr:hypothetical protein [Rhodococcus sp. 06-1059B-a]OZD58358.1 hypothetical protein CH263_24140 [Rhodococcus sp. 06-1059B-a]
MSERSAKARWTDGLVVVSIVAVGIVVAGALQAPAEPELTTAATSPTVEPEPTAPEEYVRVSEPVDTSAPIPGCDTVVEADEERLSMSFVGERSYDNPRFPWFNGPKATAMSDAVASALPDDVELAFAAPQQSLLFGPIFDFGDGDEPPYSGSTDAWGAVNRGDASGSVQVSVQQGPHTVPGCVAGSLDERKTLPDGTVVDLLDTWAEINGVRTISRSVQAYTTDGTWIHVSADDRTNTPEPANSGEIPLTLPELELIATEPALRVSTPVPPGTPPPSEGCSGYTENGGPDLTREDQQRLNSALASVDLGAVALDRKLDTLQPSDMGLDTLCMASNVVGADETLQLSIAGGQAVPVEDEIRPDPYSGTQDTFRSLADGTVVQTSAGYYGVTGEDDGDYQQRSSNTVTVTRPGGTRVQISASSAGSQSLSIELLESIALTPGLEVS